MSDQEKPTPDQSGVFVDGSLRTPEELMASMPEEVKNSIGMMTVVLKRMVGMGMQREARDTLVMCLIVSGAEAEIATITADRIMSIISTGRTPEDVQA